MAITAALVKELRDMTGAGMMDAKKALVETDGNIDKAVDLLREKGLAAAAPKFSTRYRNANCGCKSYILEP